MSVTDVPRASAVSSDSELSISIWLAALIGLAAATVCVGIWSLAYGLNLAPFPPFDSADLAIKYFPGGLATWAIETFGHRAQQLLLAGGVLFWISSGIVLGVSLRSRANRKAWRGIGYALLALPVVLLLSRWSRQGLSVGQWFWYSIFFGSTLALAGNLASGWLYNLTQLGSDQTPKFGNNDWLDQPGDAGRRELLRKAGGAALIAGVGGGGLGWIFDRARVNETPTEAGHPLPAVRQLLIADAQAKGLKIDLTTPDRLPPLADDFPAPAGVRPRTTSNDLFYVVDITTRFPNIPHANWKLRVTGEVERELELSYEDLLSMPAVEQDGTLRCISYEYDNGLISSTRWTGVPMRDILQQAGLKDTALDLALYGAGGYRDSIPVGKGLEPRTLLAYGMNGAALPRSHGFPCRAYVPNLYGIKNVKWLERIDVIDYDLHGFWQERGWSESGIMQIISIIDTPHGSAMRGINGELPVGGIAYAGSRGIASVEVQINDTPWQPAQLEPYQPELLWQRWRFDWQPDSGKHSIRVRATDRAGNAQISAPSPPHPDGITGYQKAEVTVS